MKTESSRQRFSCFLLSAYCLLIFPVSVSPAAEEISTKEKRVKTQGGIRFNLPEDWPIEKHGAALGPVSVEEYVSRKLEAMGKRMAALEGKVSSLEKQLQKAEEEPPL